MSYDFSNNDNIFDMNNKEKKSVAIKSCNKENQDSLGKLLLIISIYKIFFI